MTEQTSPCLIDAQTLRRRLPGGGIRPADCRFVLGDAAAGAAAYAQGHIPGAVYADLEGDLAAPASPEGGRHPLPEPAVLAARLAGWGVGADSLLVAYDDAGGAFAARLWWLARWLGHERVVVLDGGWAAWRAIGGEVETRAPRPDPVPRRAPARTWPVLDTPGLAAALAADAVLLVDARAAERYRGEAEPIDPVAGHVPGAVNRPYTENLDAQGRFRSPQDLAAAWRALLGGRSPADVVQMCGSGVTACHNLLAMQVAGLPGARLYPGSWSAWCADPDRPVAWGADPG
jgi:thiosulfate/3-mercaptopyruvate sulfurtransferase